MGIPAAVINPPVAAPPRDGLFLAATGPMSPPPEVAEHWQTAGLVYEPDACGAGHLELTACATPPYATLTVDAGNGLVQAYPFAVNATYVCGLPGSNARIDELARRVKQRLLVNEQFLVEKALWHGGDGFTGIFEQIKAAGGTTDLTASTTLVGGISALEQAGAAVYQGQLVLHARPAMAAYMSTRALVRTTPFGQPDRTYFGTPISWGSGYAGTGPSAEVITATDEYVWLTGRVLIWRSTDIVVPEPRQLLDKSGNQLALYAFRNYAVAVECLAANIKVTKAG